jgi:hypothetical protein
MESFNWKTPVFALVGLVVGVLFTLLLLPTVAGGVGLGGGIGGFGVPEMFIVFGGAFWLTFWLFLLRGLFWGGPWGRRGRYYRLEDLPADFDEWHRRAHEHMRAQEQMKGAGPADSPAGRG